MVDERGKNAWAGVLVKGGKGCKWCELEIKRG